MSLRPPRPVGPALRALDRALVPLMFVVGGCQRTSVQETHRWHCEKIAVDDVALDRAVIVDGDDPSPYLNQLWPLPLFHIPVFGGWRKYVVLEARNEVEGWYVGWIHLNWPQGARVHAD